MTPLLPARIHLVRHGETVWHAENRYAGSTDVALTELGVAQAESLGRWAGRRSLAAVYSSNLSRAIATATPAAVGARVELQIRPRLREVDFGLGEGTTRAEMQADFPVELDAFVLHPASIPLPAGESGLEAIERAWPALEEIAATHGGEEVLVVMHSTLMRLVLCRVLSIESDRYRTAFPSVQNAAITTVTLGREPALHAYNVPLL